jgi:hypothetical protein
MLYNNALETLVQLDLVVMALVLATLVLMAHVVLFCCCFLFRRRACPRFFNQASFVPPVRG